MKKLEKLWEKRAERDLEANKQLIKIESKEKETKDHEKRGKKIDGKGHEKKIWRNEERSEEMSRNKSKERQEKMY